MIDYLSSVLVINRNTLILSSWIWDR